MGMGHYPQYADTVDDKFVRQVCPGEIDELQVVLDEVDYDWQRLGMSNNFGDLESELEVDFEDEQIQRILKVYDELCRVFQTKTGLELKIRYHDSDDRGDEVNGFFWEVDGVYILSLAGKKYQADIERKFWTDFG